MIEEFEESKEKPTLKRLLKKGYEPTGMFDGYVILNKRDKQILYDKFKDKVVKDKKYIGEHFSDKE